VVVVLAAEVEAVVLEAVVEVVVEVVAEAIALFASNPFAKYNTPFAHDKACAIENLCRSIIF